MIAALWPKIALAIGLVAGVGAAGVGTAVSNAVQTAAQERQFAAAAQLETARYQETLARFDLTATTSAYTVLAAIAAERPGLLEAAATAKTAIGAAAGKVDVAAQQQTILDAENRAIAERSDPAVVRAAADAIRAAAGEITAAVDAYAQAAAAAGAGASGGHSDTDTDTDTDTGTSTGTGTGTSGGGSSADTASNGQGDWFAHARAVLDQVGGGGIELRAFDGGCGDALTGACAFVPAYIAVTPDFADLSQGHQVWVMTHEVAHFSEVYVWFELQDSPRFSQLFGGDIERLANCMAQVRGAYSGCSGDELAFAAGIWDGVVS